jgi:hypothetical protein
MAPKPRQIVKLNHSSGAHDALDRVVLDLLARLLLTWEPLDFDNLTAREQEALKLLTAAGMVERRLTFRLRLIGHSVSIEATIAATGEYGIMEALEPVAKAAWLAWAGDYLKGKVGTPQDQPTFLCERTGPEQARLTQEGQQAREDVEAGNAQLVLDFVHRRTTPFVGQVVRGQGKAEKVHTQTAPVTTPSAARRRMSGPASSGWSPTRGRASSRR